MGDACQGWFVWKFRNGFPFRASIAAMRRYRRNRKPGRRPASAYSGHNEREVRILAEATGRYSSEGTVYGINREVPHDGSLNFEEASFIRLRDLPSPALYSNTMRHR